MLGGALQVGRIALGSETLCSAGATETLGRGWPLASTPRRTRPRGTLRTSGMRSPLRKQACPACSRLAVTWSSPAGPSLGLSLFPPPNVRR